MPVSPCQDPQALSKISSFFKVLGDETRLKILFSLFETEQCTGDIAASVAMTKSAVSHQLRLLRMEGLIKSRREGKNVYYSLDDQHVCDILEVTCTHVSHKHQA